MRLRVSFFVALCLATCPGPILGQTPKSPSELNLDFSVPESPAFTVLGLTPQTVTRPASPRDFATALLNGVDENGNFQTGVALDTAPYMLLAGKKVTLDDYQGRRIVRFFARTQLSFATTKGANEDDKSARMALGLHFTLFDLGDPRGNKPFLQCLVNAAERAEAKYKEELGLPPTEPLFGPLLSPDTALARKEGLQKRTDQQAKTCRDNQREKSWNRSSWIVAAAPSWTSNTGSASDFQWNGAGVWTSLAYGFEKVPGLEDAAQLIFHARYRNKEQVPDPAAQGQFLTQNSVLVGGRLRFGTENTALSFEGVYSHTKRPGDIKDDFGKISGGVERKITDNLWFVLTLGGETTRLDGNNKVFVLTSFNWGFSRK